MLCVLISSRALKQCIQSRITLSHRKVTLRFYSGAEMSRGTNLRDIVKELEDFADPKLAEPWDNVGLLVEPTQPNGISKVLLTNDLTQTVMDDAISCKANLIISYHPPIFAPLKRFTQASWKEKIIATCLENKIAVYSPHTAWDATPGGVGDSLASTFSEFTVSIKPIISNQENELICNVHTSKITMDSYLCKCPQIQTLCSLPSGDGKEMLYTIVASKRDAEDMASLPGTIVTKVEQVNKASRTKVGMGRFVQLVEGGCSLNKCVDLVKQYTCLNHVRLAKGLNHTDDTLVKTVALVPGSGGSLLKGVRADLYVTGEMLHHDILDAVHRGSSVILTNHSDSERPFLTKFKSFLECKFPSIAFIVSSVDKDPIETV